MGHFMVFKLCLLFSFLVAPLKGYSDISFHTKIDIAHFESKTVKSSWCFTTNGWSKTFNSSISKSLTGDTAQYTQTYSAHGKQILARRISWDSLTTERSFYLNFNSGSSSFEGATNFDSRKCSYKTWRGSSAAASNVLVGKAGFIIPKDVWLIRVHNDFNRKYSATEIKLFNKDYERKEGKNKLIKKEIASFRAGENNKYYFVNPSTDEFKNLVYLELNHVNNSTWEDNLKFNFKIDFIGRDECIKNLTNIQSNNIIWNNIENDRFEAAITNLSCMLTPQYVKHILSNLFIFGIHDFYDELDKIEKHLSSKKEMFEEMDNLNYYSIVLKLINKVKFYYSYEILKDIYILLKYESKEELNGLQYLETLRTRSLFYIKDLLSSVDKTVKKSYDSATSYKIKLTESELLKIKHLIQYVLQMEINSVGDAIKILPRLNILGVSHFGVLTQRTQELINAYLNLKKNIDLLLKNNQNYTVNFLVKIRKDIRSVFYSLDQYTMAWESFKQNYSSAQNDSNQIITDHREYLAQIETLFSINILGLSELLKIYYLNHFESNQFKSFEVNGKQYKKIDEFIIDFEQLMEEI